MGDGLPAQVAGGDDHVHLQALQRPQRTVGLLGRGAGEHLVPDDRIAPGRLHVRAGLRAQRLPGPVDLRVRQAERRRAPPHLHGAAEVLAGGPRRVEHPGLQQGGRVGGQQALQVGGARLGETDVDDDAHRVMVSRSDAHRALACTNGGPRCHSLVP